MVEISKAVAMDAKLLIMDEPTTVLTQYEINILYRLMHRLKSQGVTIIYISHKFTEVKAICDRVLVLRDGNVIYHRADRQALDLSRWRERMVGHELSQILPKKEKRRHKTCPHGQRPDRAWRAGEHHLRASTKVKSWAWPVWWAPGAPKSPKRSWVSANTRRARFFSKVPSWRFGCRRRCSGRRASAICRRTGRAAAS